MLGLLLVLLLAAGCGVVDSKYYDRLLKRSADAGEDDAGSAPDAATDSSAD